MITQTCIYCGSTRLQSAYQRADGRSIVSCEDCRLLFISDIPDDLAALYGSDYFHKTSAEAGNGYDHYDELSPISFRWQLALTRLFAANSDSARLKLLDVGCATGHFLKMAGAAGYDCAGVEISESAAESVRAQGFPVLVSAFERSQPKKCDLITGWDFIEHVVELRKTFEKVKATLRPGGVFLFATPDGGSSRAQEHGKDWICLNSSFEHITYLTRLFLDRALRDVFGCEPLLLSFDVGLSWTSIIGMVRVGGLTDQDRRIGALLSDESPPATDEEVLRYSAELGWFFATFLQLPSLTKLLDRAEGLLPAPMWSALQGALLYQSEQYSASTTPLSQGLSAEPLCGAWLARAHAITSAQREQSHQAQLEQQQREATARSHQLEQQAAQLWQSNQRMMESITWKIGRSITEPIERVPHSRALLSGLQLVKERGSLETMRAAQRYVQSVTQGQSPLQQAARKLTEASLALTESVTEYVTEHVVPAGLAAPAQRFLPAFLKDKLTPVAAPKPPRPLPASHTTKQGTRQSQSVGTSHSLRAVDLFADPALLRHQGLPLVSVILPVYNQTDLLRSSVLSVLSQSYPNVELVIVDDGSKEDVVAALGELLDLPAVRLFRQVNQKLPRALSNAFQFAKGQLLTWTSADNLMHPHAIARLADVLLRHPEAVLTYADVQVIDDNGNALTDKSYREQNVDPLHPEVIRLYRSDVPLSAERDNYINACFLYRRSASDSMGHVYADSLRGAEDYDFWLRLRRCGRLLHIGNTEPLYSYRVHQRSMSHDLLTQERNAHFTRVNQLLSLEAQRVQFGQRRWDVVLDQSIPHRVRAQLTEWLQLLPVQILSRGSSSQKRVLFLDQEAELPGSTNWLVVARVLSDSYQLICRPPKRTSVDDSLPPCEDRVIRLPQGCTPPAVLWKARDVQPVSGMIPSQAGGRPVFAISIPVARMGSGINQLRKIISANPWAFFLFVSESGPAERAQLDGLQNAALATPHQLEAQYLVYGSVQWLLIPPCEQPLSLGEYLAQLGQAFATQHPLVLCEGTPQIVAPYQLCLGEDPSLSLQFAQGLTRNMMQTEVLNSYLTSWQPEQCLSSLLAHANTFAQDFAVTQPQTGITPPVYAEPKPVQSIVVTQSEPCKTVMLVDSLDVGGLEEVVAFLVRNLPALGIQTSVACLSHGGFVADKLRREGHQVMIANGSTAQLIEQLQALGPALVNSHYASLPALEAAATLRRPIVETIHNTYVWLSQEQWQTESERSRHFAKALAVSSLVKRYYHAHNHTLSEDLVQVVGNAIDPDRIAAMDMQTARAELGISDAATVFLCLGRYCSQKNQLGIVHAFAQVAERDPSAFLLCMGNAPKEEQAYFQQLQSTVAALPCRDRIRLESYHPNVSTVLSAADAMVMDSFFEGWSLAATEALLSGTPLIHSLCGSAEELCGADAERGFVIPNPGGDIMQLQLDDLVRIAHRAEQPNHPQLTEAMLRVVSERDRLRTERTAISAYARRVFHPSAILSRYAKTFRSLTSAS
jgi:glycosyltransferase involved in cell wall biosynthesis/SAM-dependent methyltransferase